MAGAVGCGGGGASWCLEDGERLALEAWQAGSQAFGEAADVELQAQVFWIRWRQGRLSELDGAVAALGDRHRGLPVWRAAAVLIDAECGRAPAARTALEAMAADGFAAFPRDANWLVTAALLAAACDTAGAAGAASRLEGELAAYAGRRAVTAFASVVLDPSRPAPRPPAAEPAAGAAA